MATREGVALYEFRSDDGAVHPVAAPGRLVAAAMVNALTFVLYY